MTIRPVHVEGALTKAQYDALELTRPLCDGPIGATTGAKRSTDAAASSAFDEPDRPSTRPRWRPTGPRQPLHDDDIGRDRRAGNGPEIAGEAAVRPVEPRKPHRTTHTTPRNGDDAA